MEVTIQEIVQRMQQHAKDEKVKRFCHLNKLAKKGEILFTGSSLMEQFPIHEILLNHGRDDLVIYNRGIGGYTIPEMLLAMHEQVLDLEPKKIFINIGTNDISMVDMTPERFKEGYRNILLQIKEVLPETSVYLMEYYPVNLEVAKSNAAWPGAAIAVERRIERLPWANQAVKELAEEFSYAYINVNDGLTEENGQTKAEFSIDGIHMWPEAYEIIFRNIEKYL